ncbi:MAG: EamA family transporter, partial [Acinetobacter sp.]|nr:EamA family transporter [Acinetobacter sp.]
GFSVLLRQWTFTAWQVMVSLAIWSAVLYLPVYALFIEPQFAAVQWHHLAIQTVFHSILVVIVATVSYAKAVQKIGLFKAGSIANIAPFLAALLAVPLLNEPLNSVMICGLIGMAIGALQPWRWLPASRV